MAQGSILTAKGKQKLASATPENQLKITHFAVGDGNGGYPPLNENMTALVHEVWRGTASAPIRSASDFTHLIFETVLPANIGGFVIREAAIFDEDGDMIAIGQTAEVEKPGAGSTTSLTLTLRLRIALSNASEVNLVYQDTGSIDHQGTTNRDAQDCHPISSISGLEDALGQATESEFGRVKLASQDEVNAGTDDTTVVTPKKLRFGFSAMLQRNGYLKFPSWLGSFLIQWGDGSTSGSGQTITYPISFSSAVFAINVTDNGSAAHSQGAETGSSLVSFKLHSKNVDTGSSTSTGYRYVAIGR